MADTKISDLAAGDPALAADKVPVDRVDDTTNVYVTAQSIADLRLLANSEVTLAKMADLAASRIIGRIGSTGAPQALTGTQVTAILDAFTSALQGLVPASGGGTTTFLRADGAFAVPPGGWSIALKTAEADAIISDQTLTNDDTLKFAMLANKTYVFRSTIWFETSAAADFKWRHSGPASPTDFMIQRWQTAPAATSFQSITIDTAYSGSDIAVVSASATPGVIYFNGIIKNGANAGDFNFQWAQNVSDATTTKVVMGSYIEYRQVD